MKLLEPMMIGAMTLRNRMVMPAMGTSLAETDCSVPDRAIAYYSRRAAGGVGLVTLEITAVHRLARHREHVFSIEADRYIEGIGRLARSIQAYGAKFSVQLWHPGHIGNPQVLAEPPVAPSAVAPYGRTDLPRVLTEAEIEELAECYGEGARRAREAGVDAVEVHAAHGYLVAQFLSPLTNKRTDRYGGELPARARFLLEIVRRVREKVGKEYPVLVKLSAEDHVPGGNTIEETKTVARWLQEAGASALLISTGCRYSPMWTVQPMMFPRGCLIPYAAAVKTVVDLPVGTIGRINNPALAEQVLQEGHADFIAMGRAVLADPDFARKVQEGRGDEIRRCIACRFCTQNVNRRIQCMINPETGRELEWTVEKAREPKKVLVVGGGPGGLEAATTAARRGHSVTLCEQASFLGGMVALGSKPPSKMELGNLVEFYDGELRRTGVEVRLGERVTEETVRETAPDVVVVATGSSPIVPRIPGIDQPNVVQARDVLAGTAGVGRSAVVIGGGDVGCETAEYLRARGLEVTVLEMLDRFARDMEPVTREVFLSQLQSMGVSLIGNAKVVRIEGQRVVYVGTTGQEATVEGETIVLALGGRPNTELMDQLEAQGVPVVAVGDCIEPRRIVDAVYEGGLAGRGI